MVTKSEVEQCERAITSVELLYPGTENLHSASDRRCRDSLENTNDLSTHLEGIAHPTTMRYHNNELGWSSDCSVLLRQGWLLPWILDRS